VRMSPCSRPGSSDAKSSPCDSQTYNGLKVHFSATVGEEPETEVLRVWPLGLIRHSLDHARVKSAQV
jgi:hypothetical protein